MFYFSHPFGIASPPNYPEETNKSRNQQTNNGPSINYNVTSCKSNHNNMNSKKKSSKDCSNKKSTYIPWPHDTWRRDYILPPLIQMLAKQMGQFYF